MSTTEVEKMLEIEKEIIKEAVRLNIIGLPRDEAYAWAKRWRFIHFDYSSKHQQYEAFIDSLSVALNR